MHGRCNCGSTDLSSQHLHLHISTLCERRTAEIVTSSTKSLSRVSMVAMTSYFSREIYSTNQRILHEKVDTPRARCTRGTKEQKEYSTIRYTCVRKLSFSLPKKRRMIIRRPSSRHLLESLFHSPSLFFLGAEKNSRIAIQEARFDRLWLSSLRDAHHLSCFSSSSSFHLPYPAELRELSSRGTLIRTIESTFPG